MTTAAIALVAALTAVAVAALLAAIGRRTRAASETRVGYALREMGERMDELARDLTASMERLREDAAALARSRRSARRSISTRYSPASPRRRPHSRVAGGERRRSARRTACRWSPARGRRRRSRRDQEIGGPPDGSRVRAVGLSYHYPTEEPGDARMRSAIAVPLEIDAQELGFLAVFARGEDPRSTGRRLQMLEAIASHAGPAIENARQHREASAVRRSTPSPGSEPQALHETLAQEVARARRLRAAAGRLQLRRRRLQADERPDREPRRRRDPRRGCGGAPRHAPPRRPRVPQRRRRVRRDPARGGPDRGRGPLRARPGDTAAASSPHPGLSLSAGIAELKPDDDGVSVFQRSERALQRAKAR